MSQGAKTKKPSGNGKKPKPPELSPEHFQAMIGMAETDKQKKIIKKFEKFRAGKGKPLSGPEIKELEKLGSSLLPPDCVMTLKELSEALSVTKRTLDIWRSRGMPVEPGGHYSLKKIREWRQQSLDFKKRKTRSQEMEQAELEFRLYKNELQRMKVEEAQGLLVNKEEMDRLQVQKVLAVKNRLLALPRQAAPVLAGMEAREIEAWLKNWAINVIEGFSEESQPEEGKA